MEIDPFVYSFPKAMEFVSEERQRFKNNSMHLILAKANGEFSKNENANEMLLYQISLTNMERKLLMVQAEEFLKQANVEKQTQIGSFYAEALKKHRDKNGVLWNREYETLDQIYSEIKEYIQNELYYISHDVEYFDTDHVIYFPHLFKGMEYIIGIDSVNLLRELDEDFLRYYFSLEILMEYPDLMPIFALGI